MEKISQTPPDTWTQVIILWEHILKEPGYPIKKILEWVEEHDGGQYYLRGYNSTDGFDFRFERAEDATMIKLRWL